MSAPALSRTTPWSAFHSGERILQARVGVRERLEEAGPQIMREFMPDQHRELFEKLPLLLVGSLDAQGRPWASILTGRPGLRPRAGCAYHDDRARAPPMAIRWRRTSRSARRSACSASSSQTRRRNRVNGTVIAIDADGFTVHRRPELRQLPAVHPGARAALRRRPGTAATRRAQCARRCAAVAGGRGARRRADTFFIASAAAHAARRRRREGVDVSHRGGKPGFVRVTEEERPHRADRARLPRQLLLQHPRQPRGQPTRRACSSSTSTAATCSRCRQGGDRSGTGRRSPPSPAPSGCCASTSTTASLSRTPCRCAGPNPNSHRSSCARGPGARV